MADCCANCRFVLVSGEEAICRRNPPTPALVVAGQDSMRRPVLQVRGTWPPVRMDFWCGEHRKGIILATAADERLAAAAPAGTH